MMGGFQLALEWLGSDKGTSNNGQEAADELCLRPCSTYSVRGEGLLTFPDGARRVEIFPGKCCDFAAGTVPSLAQHCSAM
jgi:hypothetical protein